MPDPGFDFVDAIEEHSAGLATAATDHLGQQVEHCPEWTVADLVDHVTDVHWFWATIVEESLTAPPDGSRRPERAPETQLISTFQRGAERLANVLRAADQSHQVWTWAPAQQNVAFVTRHQVQEAAVH